MRFGQRRAAVAAVVMVCGAMALVSFVSAQTLDRDFRHDVFRAPGAGSEIAVSVRELSNDEVSKARLERAGGVYVQSIREGSPAARADIRSGDLIVEIDGERVRGVRHFVRLVSFAPVLPPEIRGEVERRLREFPRDLELDLPAPRTARARLGITTPPLTNQLAEYFGVKDGGVLVSAVEERSPSATAGLKPGDVIIAIDGAPVRTQDVAAAHAERLQERCWTFEWSAKRKKRRSPWLVRRVAPQMAGRWSPPPARQRPPSKPARR